MRMCVAGQGYWGPALVLLGVLLCLGWGRTQGKDSPTARDHLYRVLGALERALDFLGQEHRNLNLDAVIGTRVVEGQFGVLLHHLNAPNAAHVTNDVITRIKNLQIKADHVSQIATPFVKLTQPKYYARIGMLLRRGFWTLDYPSRNIDPSLITKRLYSGESMHEKDSDDCLTELFGTSGKTEKTCQISHHCWNMMTSPGFRGYSLSHEVFYMEIAKQFGCLQGSVLQIADGLSAGFCANMLQEASEISHQGYNEKRRDLFMELPALCGMLGYRQFFQESWLNQILSWQHPSGCYGQPEDSSSGVRRVRREEKNLPDGCQCHRTAVAVGALAEYARYIIEYMQISSLGR